jgi:methionyl aminopeptidase
MITIKSKKEIELMIISGKIVAEIFEILKNEIKPGVSTIELDRIVGDYIRRKNAIPSFKGYEGLPGAIEYPASICSSVNDEVVHGIPGLRVLKDGDIISIDVGVCLNGFHADAARTYPVGEISDKAERLIKVTRQSFYEGIKKAVRGNRIVDISSAIQDYVEANGFSVVREYVGHGIGRDMHESPQIPNYRTREKGPRLEPGMALAIEPMINEGDCNVRLLENRWTVVTADGSLSAHYENTISVTDGEPLILTKLN